MLGGEIETRRIKKFKVPGRGEEGGGRKTTVHGWEFRPSFLQSIMCLCVFLFLQQNKKDERQGGHLNYVILIIMCVCVSFFYF